MSRRIILLSGGIDSAVALAWTKRQSSELVALSFQYHLRPFRERLAAYRLLETYPAKLIEVPMRFLKEATDTNHAFAGKVPEGYVANRNMIFYSIACHYAEMEECDAIVGGHTAEDQEAFPDAAGEFFRRFELLANEALLAGKIKIEMPLGSMTKLEVLQKAVEWGIPLQHTWSCYWDGRSPCGTCISCRERAEAFQSLNLSDPLVP